MAVTVQAMKMRLMQPSWGSVEVGVLQVGEMRMLDLGMLGFGERVFFGGRVRCFV